MDSYPFLSKEWKSQLERIQKLVEETDAEKAEKTRNLNERSLKKVKQSYEQDVAKISKKIDDIVVRLSAKFDQLNTTIEDLKINHETQLQKAIQKVKEQMRHNRCEAISNCNQLHNSTVVKLLEENARMATTIEQLEERIKKIETNAK